MKNNSFTIKGRVTKPDKQTGIHGLLIDICDKDHVFDDLLGSVRTRKDGSFSITYGETECARFLAGNLKFYITIQDRDHRVIHAVKKTYKCSPGQTVTYNIALKDQVLANHFSRSLSLDPVDGSIIPREKINLVEEAFYKITFGDDPQMRQTLSANFFCPLGPMIEFDDLVREAMNVIEGDPVATQSFRDILTNFDLWQKRKLTGVEFQIDIERDELLNEDLLKKILTDIKKAQEARGSIETIVPRDTSLALIAAAILSGAGQPKVIHNHLRILLDQFYGMSHFGTIFRTAEAALINVPGAIERFSRVMKYFGGAWGPDDHPPFPPFPEPQPRPEPRPSPVPWPPDPFRPQIPSDPVELEIWECIAEAVLVFRRYFRYSYVITALSNENACPGDILTITGNGFGSTPQKVRFRTGSGSNDYVDVDPASWSETQITVRVPEAATCGRISLRIFVETVMVCGSFIDIYKNSFSHVFFRGGRTRISLFTSFNTSNDCIRPGQTLGFRWSICNASRVTLTVQDDDGNFLLNLGSLPLSDSRTVTLANYTEPKQLTARLEANGPCGPAVAQTLIIEVQRPYRLSIDGMEITQAIQYYKSNQHLTDARDQGTDNSLQLVANKSAWVRVYMRSGQDPAFDGGFLRNITGTLIVERQAGGVWTTVATLMPNNAPLIAQDSFVNYDAERSNFNTSLNFVIPPTIMTGLLRLTANISSPDACWGGSASSSITVDVNLQQQLQVGALQIGYTGPNAAGTGTVVFPAPPLMPNIATECQFALTAFPVSSNLNLRSIGVATATAPLNNTVPAGGCDMNWGPINGLVARARTNDGNQPGWIYYGFVTQNIPITHGNVGCESGGNSASLIGRPSAFAHEVGHQLGLGHAPCGAVGSADPRYQGQNLFEPYDTGITTVNAGGNTVWQDASIGEYGLDINIGTVFNPNPARPNNGKDLMSYCNNPWISITSHNFMINRGGLNPTPIATGFTGSALVEGGGIGMDNFQNIAEDKPRPLITIIGNIDKEGQVHVDSVARLNVHYPIIDGQKTKYVAELVNEKGKIVSFGLLFTLTEHGHARGSSGDCGCGGQGNSVGERNQFTEPPFHFIAVLEDVTVGSCLQIAKDGEIVWQKKRPKRKPKLGQVKALLTKNKKLKLSWSYKTPADEKPDVWLRWSNDRGGNWNGLAIGIKEDSAEQDIDVLPAGDVIIQVLAHDGFYTVSKKSKTIKLPERPPVVAILFPVDGEVISTNIPLHLWGSVISRSGNVLDEENYVWYVDNQKVGRGINIWVSNPGKGMHQIKFVVNDPAGRVECSTSIHVK